MFFLASAQGKPASTHYRPNPDEDIDWFRLDDIDIYNDPVLVIDGDRDIGFDTFISAGVRGLHVFGIDQVTKDVQWAYAPDFLKGVLNR